MRPLCLAAPALLLAGCFASAGPVIGYAPGRGVTYGLEVSTGSPGAVEAAAGMTIRPASVGREALFYVAWEPWVLVGGTMGLTASTETGIGGLLGLWEGGPVWGGPWGNSPKLNVGCETGRPYSWMVTVSIGMHYWEDDLGKAFTDKQYPGAVKAFEYYLSPKVGVFCLSGGLL